MVLILNITTDLYLLALPLQLLWGVKLPPMKKFGVVVLFSGAVFIITASILRCVTILQVSITSIFGALVNYHKF